MAANNDKPVSASETPAVTQARSGATGSVTAASGVPVAGAMILARSLDTPQKPIPELAVLSGRGGNFHWPLRPGRYELTAMLDGRRGPPGIVEVTAGSAARVDLRFDP